ncbi:MAG: membrane protein insertion efficiency factor YidD [Candidatus Omnitrophica bacterium]|nr:membrane protein insertion efficiency factor YidD [Candidatus Omnitrophota bacterium]
MLHNICVNLINQYQRCIRPFVPRCCRFSPSCSEYAKEAFIKYGFLKGLTKAAKRLLSCHPFSGKAGYDPLI